MEHAANINIQDDHRKLLVFLSEGAKKLKEGKSSDLDHRITKEEITNIENNIKIWLLVRRITILSLFVLFLAGGILALLLAVPSKIEIHVIGLAILFIIVVLALVCYTIFKKVPIITKGYLEVLNKKLAQKRLALVIPSQKRKIDKRDYFEIWKIEELFKSHNELMEDLFQSYWAKAIEKEKKANGDAEMVVIAEPFQNNENELVDIEIQSSKSENVEEEDLKINFDVVDETYVAKGKAQLDGRSALSKKSTMDDDESANISNEMEEKSPSKTLALPPGLLAKDISMASKTMMPPQLYPYDQITISIQNGLQAIAASPIGG